MSTAIHPGDLDQLLVPRICTVVEVRDEIPQVVTLRVVPTHGEVPAFRPAQVSMVGAFGIGEAAISISSAATERGYHEYTIREAGAITSALTHLRPGDELWIRGPFGTSWDLPPGDVVIAAGGIGLAPLRSAVYEVLANRDRFGTATLVVGARAAALRLYADEYDRWRAGGLTVIETLDGPEDGWDGRVGFVHHTIEEIADQLGGATDAIHALVCGPDAMMTRTADALVAAGVTPANIQLTLERNMQCGNGLCGHCQLGGLIVCRDGPVVRWPAVADTLRIPEL